MLAIKNLLPRFSFCGVAIAFALWLAGCTPPGPRALLQADNLIREGRHREAVQTLESARKLMERDPRYWNCLGMAYHGLGDPQRALEAYRYALSIDRSNLVFVAHYNLGTLYLEQGNAASAVNELRSFCMLSNTAVPALLALGSAELRSRQIDAAERTFSSVLKIQPADAVALNGMGLVLAQRNRHREAAHWFQQAMRADTNYAPALLNLAIAYHQQPQQKVYALQRYREYLAIQPQPANFDAVRAVVQRLELELAPPRPLYTNAPAPVLAKTNAAVIASNLVVHPPVFATQRVVAVVTNPPRPVNNPTSAPGTLRAATNAPRVSLVSPPVATNLSLPKTNLVSSPAPVTPAPTVTVVALPQEKTIKPAMDVSTTTLTQAPPPVAVSPAAPIASNVWVVRASPAKPEKEKKGFLQSLNPFRSKPKPAPLTQTNSVSVAPAVNSPPPPTTTVVQVIPVRPTVPRYTYLGPARPVAGDRKAAEPLFRQGVEAHQVGKVEQAGKSYRQALEKDPAYYEAYYNLGLLAFQVSDWKAALHSYETALSINPDAVAARLNLGQALEKANYPQDAVNELEKAVAAKPDEVRGHLSLGNLYAQKLAQPSKAREHYLKVLELEPRHPQAEAIRYWLAAHP